MYFLLKNFKQQDAVLEGKCLKNYIVNSYFNLVEAMGKIMATFFKYKKGFCSRYSAYNPF